jgi:hypothetical protein
MRLQRQLQQPHVKGVRALSAPSTRKALGKGLAPAPQYQDLQDFEGGVTALCSTPRDHDTSLVNVEEVFFVNPVRSRKTLLDPFLVSQGPGSIFSPFRYEPDFGV